MLTRAYQVKGERLDHLEREDGKRPIRIDTHESLEGLTKASNGRALRRMCQYMRRPLTSHPLVRRVRVYHCHHTKTWRKDRRDEALTTYKGRHDETAHIERGY